MQAAKTGLTEGSTPSGEDYDREVVVINIMRINTLHVIDDGKQVVSLPGVSLHQLEKTLKKVNVPYTPLLVLHPLVRQLSAE